MTFKEKSCALLKGSVVFKTGILIVMFTCAQSLSAAPALDPHIRVLAASCAACHGTNGISVGTTPSLAGASQAHFLSRMAQFREDRKSSDVMAQHARGLTDAEIHQLAVYFSALPVPKGS